MAINLSFAKPPFTGGRQHKAGELLDETIIQDSNPTASPSVGLAPGIVRKVSLRMTKVSLLIPVLGARKILSEGCLQRVRIPPAFPTTASLVSKGAE